MKQKSGPGKAPAERVLKDIRRQTPTVFGGGEGPHRAGKTAGRGEYGSFQKTRKGFADVL